MTDDKPDTAEADTTDEQETVTGSRTEPTHEESLREKVHRLESLVEQQQDTIEQLQTRQDTDSEDAVESETRDTAVEETSTDERRRIPATRRGVLTSAGILGLLGLGAGTASADASGQIGTSSDPLNKLYTAELNGGVTGDQSLTNIAGSNLSIDGSGNLNASTGGGSSSSLVTSGSSVTAVEAIDGSSSVSASSDTATPPNVIGGHPSNNTGGNTVKGVAVFGGDDSGNSDDNTVSADFATVGGGRGNTAKAKDATVSGGKNNTASVIGATVCGGGRGSTPPSGDHGNTASGANAFVGAGRSNEASHTDSVVGGGNGNTASDPETTVGGGKGNTASSTNATVAGGNGNTASSTGATVAGGTDNTASKTRATVGGGQDNTADGEYATVPGGDENTADGNYSFATGRKADTNGNNGAFVWGDSTNTAVTAGATDEVRFQANGGFVVENGNIDAQSGTVENTAASSSLTIQNDTNDDGTNSYKNLTLKTVDTGNNNYPGDIVLDADPNNNDSRKISLKTGGTERATVDSNGLTVKNGNLDLNGNDIEDSGTTIYDQSAGAIDSGVLGNAIKNPSGSTGVSPGFDSWKQVSSDRPAFVLVEASAQTDGSSTARINVQVDESGNNSSDYSVRVTSSPAEHSDGTFTEATTSVLLPAGGQYKVKNKADPKGGNQLNDVREMIL